MIGLSGLWWGMRVTGGVLYLWWLWLWWLRVMTAYLQWRVRFSGACFRMFLDFWSLAMLKKCGFIHDEGIELSNRFLREQPRFRWAPSLSCELLHTLYMPFHAHSQDWLTALTIWLPFHEHMIVYTTWTKKRQVYENYKSPTHTTINAPS